ncbi:MAG: RHS repeat-associated core domain-containing protein [Saprospiraceae bacterium]
MNNDGLIRPADDVLESKTLYPFGMHAFGSRAGGHTRSVEDFTGHDLAIEGCQGVHDMNARQYIPELGLFGGVDPLASHPNQVVLTPYNYAWNNPNNLTAPDGRCPWCVGAFVGLALEYGTQVEVNYSTGHENPWTDINKTSLAVSAAAGAAGVGIAQKIASIAKVAHLGTRTATALRVGSEVATDVSISVASQAINNDGEVSNGQVLTDAIVGQAARATVGQVRKAAAGRSKTGKQLQENVNRESNVAQRGSSTQGRTKSDANVPGAQAQQASCLAGERAVGAAAAAAAAAATRRVINNVTGDDKNGGQ